MQDINIKASFIQDAVVTRVWKQVIWQQEEAFNFHHENFEYVEAGNNWAHTLKWKFPNFAPLGAYRIRFEVLGFDERDLLSSDI